MGFHRYHPWLQPAAAFVDVATSAVLLSVWPSPRRPLLVCEASLRLGDWSSRGVQCLRRCAGGDRDPSKGGWGGGYLTLHCNHHSDFCIKMYSNGSYFHGSLIVRGKGAKQCLLVNQNLEKTTSVMEKKNASVMDDEKIMRSFPCAG